MIVSTGREPADKNVRQAEEIARRLGAVYMPRSNCSVASLQRQTHDSQALVATGEGLKFYYLDRDPLHFHPGTSVLRIKRLRDGERENLADACGVSHGDAILDCTAGLCADSILLAYAAGPDGQVTALESEPVIALLVGVGLSSFVSGTRVVDEAMRRIRVVHGDHLSYLKSAPDKSFDIVYFDPMFRKPIMEASSISPLRQIANPAPLSVEAVREAVRVARKSVVMKETRNSGEFERLGFADVRRSRTQIAYGVIHP